MKILFAFSDPDLIHDGDLRQVIENALDTLHTPDPPFLRLGVVSGGLSVPSAKTENSPAHRDGDKDIVELLRVKVRRRSDNEQWRRFLIV